MALKWPRTTLATLALAAVPAAALSGILSPTTKAVAAEEGDPQRGQEVFRACVACHSLTPDRHMTGPSLASVWGRKAGTVEGFRRYSEALKKSGLTWDARTLDAWLTSPRQLVPGNRMTFAGIPDEAQRRDLIAFLKGRAAGSAQASPPAEATGRGMMGQGRPLDLKTLDANNRIKSIAHCGDTYSLVVENGDTYEFWEFNLRFKTDGSAEGPPAGQPVIIPGGMRGDRALVIFAAPAEISAFIKEAC